MHQKGQMTATLAIHGPVYTVDAARSWTDAVAVQGNRPMLPSPTPQDWRAALVNAQQHLHSLGITGWQDAWVTPGT